LRVALRKGMLKLRQMQLAEREPEIPEQTQFSTQVQAAPEGVAK
jgi:hypothetical protein